MSTAAQVVQQGVQVTEADRKQQQTTEASQENVSRAAQIVTNVIFWVAFISFLSTSIPHVAWLYHVYEPQDEIVWWWVCYALAISIDVMIAWLSFVETISKKSKDGWLTWLFIGLLSALSWYANYLYDMQHNPIVQHDMWNIQIFFGATTTGYITPIIISAIPIFSIAYTFMLSKVGNRKVETVDEMRKRLQDLKDRKEVEDQLKTLAKPGLKSQLKARIDDVKDVVNYAKSAAPVSDVSDDQFPDDEQENGGDFVDTEVDDFAEDEQGDNQPTTDPLPVVKKTSTSEDLDVELPENMQKNGSETDENVAASEQTSEQARSRQTVPIDVAAQMLGYSLKYTQELRKNGKLKTASRNKNLITVSSINAVLQSKSKSGQLESKTADNPAPQRTVNVRRQRGSRTTVKLDQVAEMSA